MGDLKLSGLLNLAGNLKLTGRDGGKVKVNEIEVVVETQKGQAGASHGQAPAPVPIPPPPGSPTDPGLDVWVFKSFNPTVKANGKNIVTQGICAQGNPGTATWPGMVQTSIMNSTVTINRIFINLLGDMCIILPTGAPVPIKVSGQ
ncbi:hypothetical protein L9W92_03615 [Pelotomaculum terephthalicicum JT]|uniref:hypothetical protein n=1 Tax=Pelotomaculum TaxID=191373 RepID=UPI0009D3F987|nr:MULTISPECIES: hypothetical protein [Pelotomaculum]MCG9967141.1 hypothetical protein [Pelotomaculum terephthalicicum JT]OPX90390.1 MAG: hypothetical protein A4E54_00680 [Pelotomaculum sp. PtaB.Bin117]